MIAETEMQRRQEQSADCKHTRTTRGDYYGYGGPVSVTDENRAAHGGVTCTETCRSCGARRRLNVNGCHVELGSWGPTRSQRDASHRRWQMETAAKLWDLGMEVEVEVDDLELVGRLSAHHDWDWSIRVGIRGDYRRYRRGDLQDRIADPDSTAGAQSWWARLRNAVDSCVRSAPEV